MFPHHEYLDHDIFRYSGGCAVSYAVFAEFTQESEIREEVKHDIEKLLNSGKKFRISRQEDLAGSAIATS